MKFIKILIIAVLLLGLSGCANFKTVRTDEFKQLNSELKNQFDDIKKVKIEMHYSGISCIITWKKEPGKEEILQSFEIIKDFFNSEYYQHEFLVDLFYKEYPSQNNTYPKIRVYYYIKNDDYFYYTVISQSDEEKK